MGPEPAMQLVAPGQPCPICRTGATRCRDFGVSDGPGRSGVNRGSPSRPGVSQQWIVAQGPALSAEDH